MDLLTEHEAAKKLSISVETLRNRRKQGRAPAYVKIGSSVRYRDDILDKFIADAEIKPKEKV